MARIKVQAVLESLDYDLRTALARAVQNQVPDAQFDPRSLYREFCREAGRKCSTWQRVPEQYIDPE